MRWGRYRDQSNSSLNKLDLKLPFRNKIFFVFLFIATASLLTGPFAINDAFAINAVIIKNPYANNLPTELKWQMVFISSNPACSNSNYQMVETYFDVVVEYLKLYKLDNISYDPFCITEEKYLSNYENPSDLDLLILVYDKDLGEKELHANQMGGLYTHSGIDRTQNHVIIICDCSNFDYSAPVWVLSHELSHFILYYNDFEMSVIESLIHVNDAKYDQCLEESSTCKSSSIKMMAGPGGYLYSVMPIYQPAVGVTENKVFADNANSPVTSEISKIITEWWATGIISDAQFSNAIGYLVDSKSASSNDGGELILTDEPLNNIITWEQMMEEITPTYWAHEPKSDDNLMAYLSKIPANMIVNDDNLLSEEMDFGVPEWFKETAALWGQDMITDTEFKKNIEYLVDVGIIESHSSSIFKNIVVESESVPISPSIQNSNQETNPNEPLSQDPVSEQPSDIPIESATEIVKTILTEDEKVELWLESVADDENIIIATVDAGSIHELRDSVKSIPDIDYRVITQIEQSTLSFDIGNINEACIELDDFIIILEYLINSDKIDQSLGQSLIADGELIKLDLCN